MSSLFRAIRRFRCNRSGNIAVIFALACVPLISAVGCAVDYSMAARIKAKLQSAADGAAVAAISQKSPGFVAASAMTGNGSVSAGVIDANHVFDGNMNQVTGVSNISRTSTVTKTGIQLASKLTFTADVPTTFLKVINFQKLTVSGSSSASASLPPYLDFYLTLDVSGSMGLPSTTSEAVRMQNINPDNYRQYPTGCTLACHFSPQNSACTDSGTQAYPTNNYCLGYAISRVSQSGYAGLLSNTTVNSTYPSGKKLPSSIVSGLPNSLYTNLATVANCPSAGTDSCIQLRLDAVGYAVNQLFITANSSMKVTNQFRIGLYPFIRYLYGTYYPLTSSINGSSTNSSTINYAAANLASLLDTNMDSNLGSGGTHIDTALTGVNTLIASVGDGSSSISTIPYVFLVTDGAQDPQVKGVPNGGWSGSNHATTVDLQGSLSTVPSCEALKSRGIIVSVLYIPYQPINPVNASFAGDEDDYANWNVPYIPASLQKCASPGFFYTANTPSDITAALNAMFNHALTTAHITR
ncbi:pilus assembly protein [Bradyrhizobium jicamae]|uniref:TadE/TadG family type IV pilus assembly protein n=1 Tax=Bradyrhizobium jicamae TaxID=280332 RepID=UPI001BABD160|nr:pilus assembly protein TadG-related protein [Bradyrhizobium jicamae]MBR0756561.1 pilus assembly protein [Bradyrhizobium jicamae]